MPPSRTNSRHVGDAVDASACRVRSSRPALSQPAEQRARMGVEQLRANGISDERVLAVMGELPREEFVPEPARPYAYEDRALSIGHGQTISQPFVVAAMTQALEPDAE